MSKTYREEARAIEVFDECDILVAGGGAAGHSAAIAAARAGAKNIVLLERYGYMGGDVTGGYVIMVPNLTWLNKSFVRGIQEEWFTRLSRVPGAVLGPSGAEIGSKKPEDIHRWEPIWDAVSRVEEVPKRVVRAVYFEPNQLKIEMDKMLLEERESIRVYYHSWAAEPIVENDRVKGVILESKEGRKAILAKVVIDATGDGDLFSKTRAPYSDIGDNDTRSANTALVFRVAGVDYKEFDDVIAWHSTICRINDSAPVEIPYRAILPKGVENLLCPGRHLSSDNVAIDWLNLIPQCVGTGQAAGVAAAVAVTDHTTVHDVNMERVQDILVEQDVPLPRHTGVDPELMEICEEHKYGLYTNLARMAAENPAEFSKYRQP